MKIFKNCLQNLKYLNENGTLPQNPSIDHIPPILNRIKTLWLFQPLQNYLNIRIHNLSLGGTLGLGNVLARNNLNCQRHARKSIGKEITNNKGINLTKFYKKSRSKRKYIQIFELNENNSF